MQQTSLPQQWQHDGIRLERVYDLGSFQQAVAFVQTLADLCEAFSEEPEIAIKHSAVTLRMSASPNTEALARQIERAAQAHGAT